MTACTHKIASRSAIVALALGILPSVALAEPVELTQAQMEQVTAGAFRADSAGQRRLLEIVSSFGRNSRNGVLPSLRLLGRPGEHVSFSAAIASSSSTP